MPSRCGRGALARLDRIDAPGRPRAKPRKPASGQRPQSGLRGVQIVGAEIHHRLGEIAGARGPG